MLSIKERQKELKILGYYKGEIDGKEGKLTKEAYLKLQKDFFFRKKDKDGIYGTNTDKLLQSVYNVKTSSINFDIKKDKMYCHCKGKYCTGYPAIINQNLVRNLQAIRNKYGRTTLTSVLRCKEWNKKVGGTSNSRHLKGLAADYRNKKCLTLKGRKEEINFWFTLNKPNFSYCNGYYKTNKTSGKRTAKGMGISIHGDVK